MKKFYVLWTYAGNYSERVIEVEARDEFDARVKVLDVYAGTGEHVNERFKERAKIFVFTAPPALVSTGGLVKIGGDIFKLPQ